MGVVRRMARIGAALLGVGVAGVGLAACHVAGTVHGVVWEDLDRDGRRGEGEPAIAGVFLRGLCLQDDGSERDCAPPARSNRDGLYQFRPRFPSEEPIRFVVEVELPTGYALTEPHWGGLAEEPSAIDPASNRSTVIVLHPEGSATVNVGLYRPGVGGIIGGRLWEDDNGNGVQDAGEEGAEFIRVNLRDEARTLLAQRASTATGAYAFGGLAPGTYLIEVETERFSFTVRDQGDDTTDSDVGDDGFSDPIALGPNEMRDVDAGLISPSRFGSVHGRVFRDLDRDGDSFNDPGVGGVEIQLLDADGQRVQDTVSTALGLYEFNRVEPGEYRVRFDLPEGFAFTDPNQVDDDRVDSDVTGGGGETDPFTIALLERVRNVDAGLVSLVSGPGAIGDLVWEDVDADGIQDPDEAGVSGVDITLRRNDGPGTIVATTTSGLGGAYRFTDVAPGAYQVQFVTPAGYSPTVDDAGDDDSVDSDRGEFGLSHVVYVFDLQTDDTVDAGFVRGAGDGAIGDLVWEDVDADGIQDPGERGVPNVRVRLFAPDGTLPTLLATTFTDDGGLYEFPLLAAGQYFIRVDFPDGFRFTGRDQGSDDTVDSDVASDGISGVIDLAAGVRHRDLDAGLYRVSSLGDFVWEDLDADGIQDAGEPGVPNVVVSLVRDGSEIRTAVTDDGGLYGFVNLDPGPYMVRVNIPGGFEFTEPDQGTDDSADSDVNFLTGQTQPITLATGEANLTVDAGLVRQPSGGASLGDVVWHDVNGNGIQDPTEPGLPNVVVTLLDGNGAVVAQNVTDDGGAYGFANLAAGTYRLRFADLREFGFSLTAQNAGGDDAVDSDVHPVTRETDLIALAGGQQDDTVDAGYMRPA